MLGVSAWLIHRAADKKRREVQLKIESTNAETAYLERIARAVSAECHRIDTVTLRTNEPGDGLARTLQALRANMHSLKTTGDALAQAMNAPGFDLSDLQAKES